MQEQISVFVIYAREDREIKQRLLRHLNPLKNSYNLNIWHDDYIEPGQEWKASIESRLAQTDLFLLLISADFMNSEFIHQVEFKFAIDRHKQNKSIVVPVIIDYCLWDIDIKYQDYTFNLNSLQVLPDEGKPIGDWKTPEQAYNNIAGSIRKVLSTIREKRGEGISGEIKKDDDKKPEKNISEQRAKNEREENLQKQIAEQREKEAQYNSDAFSEQGKAGSGGYKKILVSTFLIVLAVAVLAYFIFRETDEKNSKVDAETTMITKDTSGIQNTVTPTNTSDSVSDPKPQSGTYGGTVRDHRATTDVPVNSFNTFSNALAAVFKAAPGDFANLKGEFNGTQDGMRKYKTSLTLRDKEFLPLYILENGGEWKFVFINKKKSNYEAIKSSIETLLEKKGIKYEVESSASMGFLKYNWDNEKFEISLSTGKYTDQLIEVDFYHRN